LQKLTRLYLYLGLSTNTFNYGYNLHFANSLLQYLQYCKNAKSWKFVCCPWYM